MSDPTGSESTTSEPTNYEACASLTDAVAGAVHAIYAEIGSRAGLGAYADVVASIPADFVGHPGGGWEAVCATMFGEPSQASPQEHAAPALQVDAGSHGDNGGGGSGSGSGE